MAESNVYKLKGELRTATGRAELRDLRNSGYVPAVVYQNGEEAISLQFDLKELRKMLADRPPLIEIMWGDDEDQILECLIREIQRHPVKRQPIHLDFLAIARGVEIETNVPLVLVGTPIGVKSGGVLQQARNTLPVLCMPRHIPRSIDVDVTHLEINDAIHVGEIEVENVKILEEPERTIASVVIPRILEEETEEDEELEEGEVPLVGEEGEEGEEGEGEESGDDEGGED